MTQHQVTPLCALRTAAEPHHLYFKQGVTLREHARSLQLVTEDFQTLHTINNSRTVRLR